MYRAGINFLIKWNISIEVVNSMDDVVHYSHHRKQEDKDEMNAALAWQEALHSPRPPFGKLSYYAASEVLLFMSIDAHQHRRVA